MGFWGFGEQYVTERRKKQLRIAPQNPKTPVSQIEFYFRVLELSLILDLMNVYYY